jgi:GTPase SAR1 family protein
MIDQISFHNAIGKWYNEISEECPKAIKIFVGTKSDLHREYLADPQQIHKAIPLDYVIICLFLD